MYFLDYINIESQSGYDVINNSIINDFNNPERSVVLHCVTVRHYEGARWIFNSHTGLNVTYLNSTTYLSTIQITDTRISTLAFLTCTSQYSGDYRTVTIMTGTFMCT